MARSRSDLVFRNKITALERKLIALLWRILVKMTSTLTNQYMLLRRILRYPVSMLTKEKLISIYNFCRFRLGVLGSIFFERGGGNQPIHPPPGYATEALYSNFN